MANTKNQALPAGTVLRGRVYTYKIEKELGQGTFGITYLASTSIAGPLGKVTVQVALKEFFAKELDSRMSDGSVTARTEEGIAYKYARAFQRESENLSKMQHPGIVNVLEAFEDKGTYYYSMEYLSGGSLDDKVRGIGIPEEEALPLITKIGDALSYMHDRKVMHLDLKPKNIMLNGDGEPVIIDFGLSKQYDEKGEPESSSTIGLGTPGYAPLEQATQTSGKAFQPTLDIYALGATLYKMLTGSTPPVASEIFNEGFPEEILLRKAVSRPTIGAIRKAMSAAKKDRPQSIDELLSFLTRSHPTQIVGLKTGTKLHNGEYEIIKALSQSELETIYVAQKVSSRKKVSIREFYDIERYSRVVSTGEILFDDGVVLRICDEDTLKQNNFYNKFISEAQFMASLSHKNIVKVHDLFNENGTAYCVTDYIKGGSLEDMVKNNGHLSEKLAELYIRQIADALVYIHSQGKVFLNVEPGHILLNDKGEAVLINPISKTILAERFKEGSDCECDDLPAPPMNPYHGLEYYPYNNTPSADIYSLGATLYYLLTGNTPPPPDIIVQEDGLNRPGGLSNRMWKAISQSMSPQRKHRPQTVEAFLSLLTTSANKTKPPKKTAAKNNDSTDDTEFKEYEKSVIEKIAACSSSSMLKTVLPLCTTEQLKNEWYNRAVNRGLMTHDLAVRLLSAESSTSSAGKTSTDTEKSDNSNWRTVIWVVLLVLWIIFKIIQYSI